MNKGSKQQQGIVEIKLGNVKKRFVSCLAKKVVSAVVVLVVGVLWK